MAYTATEEQRQDERQIDAVLVVGEALVRFRSRFEERVCEALELTMAEMRAEVAAPWGDPLYIAEGSAATAIVAGERRRAARAVAADRRQAVAS